MRHSLSLPQPFHASRALDKDKNSLAFDPTWIQISSSYSASIHVEPLIMTVAHALFVVYFNLRSRCCKDSTSPEGIALNLYFIYRVSDCFLIPFLHPASVPTHLA
jgi:hypothetical protein